MGKHVVFTEEQFEEGIDKMAGYMFHGGFLTRRALGDPVDTMTFPQFSDINRTRCSRWHEEDGEPWSAADWSNALCGEAGELANKVKKYRRLETNVVHRESEDRDSLIAAIGDEIADVVIYADLVADYFGLDLAEIVAAKFNKTSEEFDFPERL